MKFHRFAIRWILLLAVLVLISWLEMLSTRHRGAKPIGNKGVSSSKTIFHSRNTTDLEGFFDCDRSGSSCVYFRPHSFFRNGPGSAFIDNKTMYKRLGGENKNLPACTSLSWDSSQGSDDQLMLNLPVNLTFCHTHKCGGTTVLALMQRLRDQLRRSKRPCSLETYKYSIGGGTKQQKQQNDERRAAHLRVMDQRQRNFGTGSFPVFTTVRDPVDRFLSAIQQVMHYNDDFRRACLKTTAQATIQCAIQDIDKTNYRNDVHLIPMVSHLRLFEKYENITVSVFHLDDSIGALVDFFLNVVEEAGSRTAENKKQIHARDRSSEHYATSKVLAQMSVSDCNDIMIRKICNMYAIDVAMMECLGYKSGHCTQPM